MIYNCTHEFRKLISLLFQIQYGKSEVKQLTCESISDWINKLDSNMSIVIILTHIEYFICLKTWLDSMKYEWDLNEIIKRVSALFTTEPTYNRVISVINQNIDNPTLKFQISEGTSVEIQIPLFITTKLEERRKDMPKTNDILRYVIKEQDINDLTQEEQHNLRSEITNSIISE